MEQGIAHGVKLELLLSKVFLASHDLLEEVDVCALSGLLLTEHGHRIGIREKACLVEPDKSREEVCLGSWLGLLWALHHLREEDDLLELCLLELVL